MKINHMTSDKKTYLVLATTALIFFVFGWFSSGHFKNNARINLPIRENSVNYKFINPLLAIDNSSIIFEELAPLKKEFEDYINKSILAGKTEQASVYFRDVNTIKWTGVNENTPYSPSSMLKVATLIAYLKTVNQDLDITKKQFYYEFKDDSGQFYKPKALKNGYYTTPILLQQMIIHSDNIAMDILDQDLFDQILKIYDELDIPSPLGSSKDFMSPIQYSRIFRILYNSTYLPRSYSEQALQLLTKTSFNNGIVAGLPTGIVTAHKFGEQTFVEDGVIKSRELHDCGIVYYPEHPYLICIMTKGQNFLELEKIIASLSKIAYSYQEKKNQ